MRISDQYHLTYCTNVHPAETWVETFLQLQKNIPEIKAALGLPGEFGIGLRLSCHAATELLSGNNFIQFRQWLTENNLYVFTINGFPYGNFHKSRVKDDVHTPDWQTSERTDYTKKLAQILAEILPDSVNGSISTSPLTYRLWFSDNDSDDHDYIETATRNICEVAAFLAELGLKYNKLIQLAIEPEPDGYLSTTTDFIHWYNEWLIPFGTEWFRIHKGITHGQELIRKHIGICYDVCHSAVCYENPEEVLKDLRKNDISIPKIQVSSALKIPLPPPDEREDLTRKLLPLSDAIYLHQVIEKTDQDLLYTYPDLPDALRFIEKCTAVEWRAHYHVPVFQRAFNGLETTNAEVIKVLDYLRQNNITSHLEIETYTWDVFPSGEKNSLPPMITRELKWCLTQFNTESYV